MEDANVSFLDLINVSSSVLEIIILGVFFLFLSCLVLVSTLVLLFFTQLRLVLVLLHLFIDFEWPICVVSVFAASLLQSPLQNFLEARLERFLDLAFSLTLQLNRVREALK